MANPIDETKTSIVIIIEKILWGLHVTTLIQHYDLLFCFSILSFFGKKLKDFIVVTLRHTSINRLDVKPP